MGEPLKNSFGPEVPGRLADMLAPAVPGFDRAGFLAAALDGFEDKELTGRARHLATTLRPFLPQEVERALAAIVASLGPPIDGDELTGMEGFLHLPFVFFVAEYGLDDFEASMTAQYELTKRFTAEFSIRAFLDRHTDATLERLARWARDPDVHVRRLVSEGTRPRLPWAPRLRRFQRDPAPVLVLLELLKDDPALYVRRSVANNLNDIAKDHPEVVVATARRWMEGAGPERQALVRHALRTLVKQGDEGALAALGFATGSPATVELAISPASVPIGGRVSLEVGVENPSATAQPTTVDIRLHFVKASGATSPKVFKGAVLHLEPGASATIRKTVSLAQHTTRTHYPGVHRVELLVNGETRPGGVFEVTAPDR